MSPKRQSELFIPEEIIVNILPRLDVRDVVRCRCVCSRWKDLTSDEEFVQSLRRPSGPMIFGMSRAKVPEHKNEVTSHFFLDKWWNNCCTAVHKVGSNSIHSAMSSQNGFIFVKGGRSWTIVNPINRESVTIFPPRESRTVSNSLLGIFLHPVLKEYCTIWSVCDKRSWVVDYYMLNLGNRPSWRGIGNLSYQASAPDTCAVSVDNFLYWMVLFYEFEGKSFGIDIVALDIKTEQLNTMPFPFGSTTYICGQSGVELYNIEGSLSIIAMEPNGEDIIVKIWTLTDHRRRLWTSSNYVLNHANDLKITHVQPISYVHEQVVFSLDQGMKENPSAIFVGSLKHGTVRQLACNPNHGKWKFFRVCSHTPSLASLRNCKPVIHVDRDNKEQEESPFSNNQNGSSGIGDLYIFPKDIADWLYMLEDDIVESLRLIGPAAGIKMRN